jgi:hypothetical protein
VTQKLVDVIARLKVQNSTMNRKQLFVELDSMLAERNLPPGSGSITGKTY